MKKCKGCSGQGCQECMGTGEWNPTGQHMEESDYEVTATFYVLKSRETGWYFKDYEWTADLAKAQLFHRKTTAEYANRQQTMTKADIMTVKLTLGEVVK